MSPAFPSAGLAPHRTRRAEKALRDLGFSVSYGEHALAVSGGGGIAVPAERRAEDLMAAFTDPSVDAVLAADAGEGTREITDLLDAAAIRNGGKPFLGSCDNIYLHQFLASRAGLGSFYGSTFMEHFGEAGGPFAETVEHFEEGLMGTGPLSFRPPPSRTRDWHTWYVPSADRQRRERFVPGGWKWLRPGAGRGPLLGGELTLLPDVLQRFDVPLESAVLFWDLSPDNEGSLIEQLRRLGDCADLTGLAGMIVGVHSKLDLDAWAEHVRTSLDKALPATADYPILANADLGHLAPPWIVPYGETAVLDSDAGVEFPRSAQSGRRPKDFKA